MKPTEQVYSNYTVEDFQVWKLLTEQQMTFLKENASINFLKALNAVQFSSTEIPNFQKVNALLDSATGWSLTVVPNICPQKEFFEFLSQKKFTATCWIRTLAQLEYLEEPDMFHDVFGHVPLLSNEPYSIFLQELSKIALKHHQNPEAIEILGRLYWYTIEFGLIREQDKIKIYGAGLISSIGEAKRSFTNDVKIHEFDIKQMMDLPYRNDIMQSEYFIIDSFQQLYNAIPKIEDYLNEKLESVY